MKKLSIGAVLLCLFSASIAVSAAVPAGRALSASLIMNAPYSATKIIETVRLPGDGTENTQGSSEKIYRDSAGRQRTDSLDANGVVQRIEFTDSDGRSYVLDPFKKTAVETTALAPALQAREPKPPRSPTPTSARIDLGVRDIEGLLARGEQTTYETPAVAGAGSAQALVVTMETWSATDCGIVLYSKYIKRNQQVVTRLADVVLGEPPTHMLGALLSQYTVVERAPLATQAP